MNTPAPNTKDIEVTFLSPVDTLRAQLESYARDFGELAADYGSLHREFEKMKAVSAEQDQALVQVPPGNALQPPLDQDSREIKTALLHAINTEAPLSIHYQPQVKAGCGLIIGIEALLRLHHPRLGDIPPERFIAIAEHSGLIRALDLKVLRQACWQARIWHDQGLTARVAVNISAWSLVTPGITEAITRILRKEGLPMSALTLELTETVDTDRRLDLVSNSKALKRAGLELSIDDFGIGHSSLSRLSEIPFDCIKIDRSFIRNMTLSNKTMELVRGIIFIAEALGVKVVAEGVEYLDQVNALCQLGCHFLQGNLYSSPVNEDAMTCILHRGVISPVHCHVPMDRGSVA